MTPVVTVAPTPAPTTAPTDAFSWQSLARTLRHPDVFLPLIAAVLVLLVLLAWAP